MYFVLLKKWVRPAPWALAVFCLPGMLLGAEPSAPTTPVATPANAVPTSKGSGKERAAAFFRGPILTFQIDVTEAEVQAINRQNRQYAKANVTVGGHTLTNVGFHLKGAAGSFRAFDQNPALTLNFDKFTKGQRFEGLDKIHLNNSVQDGSLLAEQVSGEFFEAAGLPAARVTQARVILNKRDLGIYVVKEGFAKPMLSRFFKKTNGNFYDGGFIRDVDQELQKTSGEDPKNQADLRALTSAVRETNLQKRWEKLQAILDVDQFFTFIALETYVWHWDGYCMNKNNYRIFHDPGSDRLVFIPHGMDQMFWDPNGPILPNFQGMVAQSLLEIPEAKRRYLQRLEQLLGTAFRPEPMIQRINELQARLQPVLLARDKGQAQAQAGAAQLIQQRIRERSTSISNQLAALPRPLEFGSNPLAHLTKWRPQGEPAGSAREETTPDGKKALWLKSGPGPSWRTRVVLDPGKYRFEGMVRTQDIPPGGGSGATLRISGVQVPGENQLKGTSSWKKVSYDFAVSQAGREVVLVCESRAAQGAAWFDLESLVLIRQGL